MSQNSDNKTDKKDLLGKVSVLLGIVATALGIFISFRTYIISEQTQGILGKINELEVTNKALNNELTKLEIEIRSLEIKKSKPRIEKEFLVLNAKVLTNRIYDAKNVRIIWPDQEIQDDMMPFVSVWRGEHKLMTGLSRTGLFLRQVICLRLINYGGAPARNVIVIFRKKSFKNSEGDKLAQQYYEINTDGWAEKNITIPDLMERDVEDKLKTEILIPLAHIFKTDDSYFRYFGSMAVPVKVTWYDNQDGLGKLHSFPINVSQESSLKTDISLILGTSE